ncbi:MAG TPA: hypothetical protein EYG86_00900 [Crocinitomicaceae bacterium]|nr:hypothetical protein [Crocinitomicaceae bacterium]
MLSIKFLTSIAVLSISLTATSQKDKGYERIYYNTPEIFSNDEVNIEIKNIVAQKDHCKMNFKIANNTSDYLLVVPNDTKVKYASEEFSPDMKEYFIKPNKSKAKTLLVNGGDRFLKDNFLLQSASIYKISLEDEKIETANFQLPASKNNFTTGDFKIILKKYDASTKEAKAVFEVSYTGNNIGVIIPSNLSVTATRKKSDQQVTYANDNKKSEPLILRKGEKTKFSAVFHIPGKIVDMQFATMQINWNNTFSETKPMLLEKPEFKIEINQALTEEKK